MVALFLPIVISRWALVHLLEPPSYACVLSAGFACPGNRNLCSRPIAGLGVGWGLPHSSVQEGQYPLLVILSLESMCLPHS